LAQHFFFKLLTPVLGPSGPGSDGVSTWQTAGRFYDHVICHSIT